MANPDAKGVPKPPPNLRVSDDENKECGNCSYYKSGRCTLPVPPYNNLPVVDEWVCDEWKAGGSDPDAFQGKNLGEAEQEALVRVRAHTRSRSQK
jgi:hypothetical protein